MTHVVGTIVRVAALVTAGPLLVVAAPSLTQPAADARGRGPMERRTYDLHRILSPRWRNRQTRRS
jgi:hypothetical protein